ncbi:MAG: bifunctional diguanylate cyclase/phosphodiesterase [Pseudomonadales bacterium]
MILCALIRDPDLRHRLSLVAADAGWSCRASDDPDTFAAQLGAAGTIADLLISDDPELLQMQQDGPGVRVLLTTDGSTRTPDGAARIPSSLSDRELLQALKTCVNARRFRERFGELERTEPITRLPRHEELFQSLARYSGQAMGLLVLQIDHAGHLYGNLDPVSKTDLLAALAEHVRAGLSGRGVLGFYDAACFVVALPDVTEHAGTEAGELLLRKLREPLRYRGGELHLTASLGYSWAALFNDSEPLWSDAWRLMRRAFEAGGNRMQSARSGIDERLPEALERDEFSLVLQPQVAVGAEAEPRLSGVEALLRWQGMEIGELAPNRFIPVAERHGHMARIGDWVLDQACRQASTWFEHLLEPLRLGVNVSPQQFHKGAIVQQIGRYRSEHWFDPAMLELELPHDAMLRLVDDHRAMLYRLRDWGVRFALDNLGSSLIDASKLLRCPADTLKIDRSVVSRIDSDPLALELATQICELGQRFDLRVVAVGVEREVELSRLSDAGCTDFQGYLFSPPVTPQAFRSLLAQAPALRAASARKAN